jgi:hypothetical protein
MRIRLYCITLLLITASPSYSQWTFKQVKNGFDDPYKIAYTASNNGAVLKLEQTIDKKEFISDTIYARAVSYIYPTYHKDGSLCRHTEKEEVHPPSDSTVNYNPEYTFDYKYIKQVAFYLSGGYHCDDALNVDIVFTVNGEFKKHSVVGSTSVDKRAVFLIDDLLTSDLLQDFKNCSRIKLRFNESHCETDYYEFNMSGSTSALNYMTK